MWTVPSVLEADRADIEREGELAALRTVLREALDRLPAMRRQAVERQMVRDQRLDLQGALEVLVGLVTQRHLSDLVIKSEPGQRTVLVP